MEGGGREGEEEWGAGWEEEEEEWCRHGLIANRLCFDLSVAAFHSSPPSVCLCHCLVFPRLFFCLFLSTSLFCLSCFCSRLPVYLSFCLYLCLILPPFSVSPVSLPFLLSVYSCVLSFLFSLALRLSAFSFSLSPTKIPFLHLPSFCLVFCLLSLLSLFLPIRYLCLALAIFLSPVCLLFCIRSLVQLPPPLCFCIFVSIFFYLSVTLCLCPFCLSDSLFSPKFIFFSVLTDRASVPITSL